MHKRIGTAETLSAPRHWRTTGDGGVTPLLWRAQPAPASTPSRPLLRTYPTISLPTRRTTPSVHSPLRRQRAPAPLASTPSIARRLLSASTTTTRTTTPRPSTTAASPPRREDRQRCRSFVFFHSSFSLRHRTPADVGSHAHRRFQFFFTLLSNFIFPTTFILHHHHTTFRIPRARGGRNFVLHPNFISRPTNLRKPGELLLHLHDSSSPTCLFIPHVKTAGECQSIIRSGCSYSHDIQH